MKNSEKTAGFNPAKEPQQASVKMGYSTPTEFVKLPSAAGFPDIKLYPEGHNLRDCESIEIKYMTARDEDILISTSYRESGETVNKLLESLIVSPKVDPKLMLEGDKNAILVQARISAFGETIEDYKNICSSCGNITLMKINIEDSPINNWKQIIEKKIVKYEEGMFFSTILPRSKLPVLFRLLMIEDMKKIRLDIQKRQELGYPENRVSAKISASIVELDGNQDPLFIKQFVENSLPAADANYFIKVLEELTPNIDLSFYHKCSQCGSGESKSVPIDLSFFFPQVSLF